MSLLSTLRPLPQRLLERLWLILSGYVPTSIEYHMTLGALNDDCLLILLDTLTMSQLFQLRGVSRRLCHLIERYSLRKFKKFVFCYDEENSFDPFLDPTYEDTIQMYFSSRKDSEKEFGQLTRFFWHWKEHHFPKNKLVSLRCNAWPLSLPLLLPCLSSLTLEHFLVDQVDSSTEEQLAINRRFVPYLNSNWSTTLTTLHLYIRVPFRPKPDNSFAQLNRLINLKHLFIEFSQLRKTRCSSLIIKPFLFPDSMPIFGQLLSFGLRDYDGTNMATLLHQLGPNLSFLSLRGITCWEDDAVAFLVARPNYARTLKTFYVAFDFMLWELFKVATQNLSSLEKFGFGHYGFPKPWLGKSSLELDSIFTDLSLLPHLQYVYTVPLFIAQLRALLARQHIPGTLPRLTSIRGTKIIIYNLEEGGDPFQPSELFDQLLPLLSRIFCRLERLRITFYHGYGKGHDEALSEQLSTKLGQLCPALEHLEAAYYN